MTMWYTTWNTGSVLKLSTVMPCAGWASKSGAWIPLPNDGCWAVHVVCNIHTLGQHRRSWHSWRRSLCTARGQQQSHVLLCQGVAGADAERREPDARDQMRTQTRRLRAFRHRWWRQGPAVYLWAEWWRRHRALMRPGGVLCRSASCWQGCVHLEKSTNLCTSDVGM